MERIGADRGQNTDLDRLATLDGHMEAGQIEFRTSWADSASAGDGDRDLVFEINSVARSADRAFNALYSYLPVARWRRAPS